MARLTSAEPQPWVSQHLGATAVAQGAGRAEEGDRGPEAAAREAGTGRGKGQGARRGERRVQEGSDGGLGVSGPPGWEQGAVGLEPISMGTRCGGLGVDRRVALAPSLACGTCISSRLPPIEPSHEASTRAPFCPPQKLARPPPRAVGHRHGSGEAVPHSTARPRPDDSPAVTSSRGASPAMTGSRGASPASVGAERRESVSRTPSYMRPTRSASIKEANKGAAGDRGGGGGLGGSWR